MLRAIQAFFDERISVGLSDERPATQEHAYRLATSALLIEVARADFDYSAGERQAISSAVRRAFDLSEDETGELMALAELEVEQTASLHEFTSLINQHFDRDEKRRVIGLLWDVAFADGDLDKYEEHLVRKVADLIYVPHVTFIRAKHEAQARAAKP